MPLGVFYKDDITNALLAAEQAATAAMGAVGGNDEFSCGYATGYRAALTTIALAFDVTLRPHPVLEPAVVEMLDDEPFACLNSTNVR